MNNAASITVRRPNGKIETIPAPAGIRTISPELFRSIRDATAAAGRGTVLSYENPEPQRQPRGHSRAVLAGIQLCPRCGTYCCGDC
jgi:hypothetical protein